MAGIAYKRDIDDVRESPALDVLGLLHQRGAHVHYADPYVPTLEARAWPGGVTLSAVPLTPAALSGCDCVVIVTDHAAFDYDAIAAHADLVVDTRNAIKTPSAHVFRLGAPAAAGQVVATPRPGTEEFAGTRG